MKTLINSIIRGFGGQIGRNAANDMRRGTATSARTSQWIIAGLLLLVVVLGITAVNVSYYNSHPQSTSTQSDSTTVKKEYFNGHEVFKGKRGGKYYYSKSGKKRYI